ncbi:lanthionine synthetase [Kribbella qitaiheensis]|uniref:Lanthionine synthetase n=1 Tax=Kribbella qitaiheensis TaxID=1544730 RepID=A0A7G6WWD4_9ACTN|nr:lanthionine synthetase LanC family protein [Kribbella qitaiheensis]QNE18299.1 lanthionine synthetase [Kribbella qitaiheensis]
MNTADAALAIAERLLDPHRVATAAPSYGIATLADGLPGTALLHARLSAVDPVFGAAANAHWNAAAEHATSAIGQGAGIYGAMGGLTASLVLGSPYLPDPDVTATATARSVSWLSARAADIAALYAESIRVGGAGTSWHVYDTISGLAGIGRVLLAAVVGGNAVAEPGLIAALTAMTTMLTDNGVPLPGWWVPTEQHPAVVAARLDHSGAADTGLAHGVAGPLALLALAHCAGYTVPGQQTAIRDAVAWLERWRADDHGWPDHATGEELDDGASITRHGRRAAWCYGPLGIARSLMHAARALDDALLTEAARADLAQLGALRNDWGIEAPTLCHGYAGVLRCATDLHAGVAERAAAGVAQSLDLDRPFLVAHVEHGISHDNPGFLTGAAGVALTLSDLAGLPSHPVTTPWDAVLLIA